MKCKIVYLNIDVWLCIPKCSLNFLLNFELAGKHHCALHWFKLYILFSLVTAPNREYLLVKHLSFT